MAETAALVDPQLHADRGTLAEPPTGSVPAPQGRINSEILLAVENMHCGGCMRAVEGALCRIEGVTAARANLTARRVSVSTGPDVPTDRLVAALAEAGFRAAPLREAAPAAAGGDSDLLRRVGIAGFAAANVMLLSVGVWAGLASDMGEGAQALFHFVSALIALPAVAYCGQPFYRSALAALSARRLNMDVPISLAILLATGMSLYQTFRGTEQVYFDAALTLLFFLLIGRYLDQRMRMRAAGAAQNLIGLRASDAAVLAEDGSLRRIPAAEVVPGMKVMVAAGERFPVDGRVLSGRSACDASLVTGETVPQPVAPGGIVYAGTVNVAAPVTVEATAADANTLLAEIGRLMEAAEQGRGLYVRLADRAARIYSPSVHLLGLATFLGWLAAGAGWEQALTIAIAVLIITCPCALALAVPAVQVAAAARLFARGILMKAPDALERLAEVDTVVLDKTGTLTTGELVLLDGGADEAALRDAARLAATSRHPLSRALARAAAERGLAAPPLAGVEEAPGLGLRAPVGDGEARLGSAEWVGVAEEAQADGPVLHYAAPGVAAIFRFADRLRPDAAETLARLGRAGLRLALLSGDRKGPVAAAAAAAGLVDWTAAADPKSKIGRLEALAAQGRRVLMVGDGLNDAPSLAAAHASMSPATGADISQTAADLVFQGERLAPVAEAVAVARQARRMALQNFGLALAYNAFFVPLAVAGFVTPLIAAIAMSSSSIAVTANAVRLRATRLGGAV
jgi:P-type Cu2+ transporter